MSGPPTHILIDSDTESGPNSHQTPVAETPAQIAAPTPGSVASLISQYQTSVVPGANTPPQPSTLASGITFDNPAAPDTTSQYLSAPNADSFVSQHIKNFQTKFSADFQSPTPTVPDSKKTQPKASSPASFSKASISSLINSDESNVTPKAAPKKRAAPKTEGAAKRAKTEGKKTPKAEPKTDAKTPKEPKKTSKADTKGEGKKTAKGKKKTPEATPSAPEKPPIHPAMATDKSKTQLPAVGLPPPTFTAEGEVKPEDAPPPPVISLNIPLLDPKNPKPGQAEVIVNVMKLAEEKYGWSVMHPNAKSALDMMDDMVDDDDDGEDEDEEEIIAVDEKGEKAPKKPDQPQEKKKKKQVKVNRKVGKYDYEDPFIDDEELQWEEEITTTKEGYFVYWGPLVDDRTTATGKKGATKGKK